jgi:hypothetical protein
VLRVGKFMIGRVLHHTISTQVIILPSSNYLNYLEFLSLVITFHSAEVIYLDIVLDHDFSAYLPLII